jgi:hypothetical protein
MITLKAYRTTFAIAVMACVFSCRSNSGISETDKAGIKQSVQNLTDSTISNLSTKGPAAWLTYFENSPEFFMASDGSIAFPDYQTAENFVNGTLTKQFRSIHLKLNDMRITPIAANYAAIGANFHEDLIDLSGKSMPFDGYFTATAHHTGRGWKYLNMHWSIKKK